MIFMVVHFVVFKKKEFSSMFDMLRLLHNQPKFPCNFKDENSLSFVLYYEVHVVITFIVASFMFQVSSSP